MDHHLGLQRPRDLPLSAAPLNRALVPIPLHSPGLANLTALTLNLNGNFLMKQEALLGLIQAHPHTWLAPPASFVFLQELKTELD